MWIEPIRSLGWRGGGRHAAGGLRSGEPYDRQLLPWSRALRCQGRLALATVSQSAQERPAARPPGVLPLAHDGTRGRSAVRHARGAALLPVSRHDRRVLREPLLAARRPLNTQPPGAYRGAEPDVAQPAAGDVPALGHAVHLRAGRRAWRRLARVQRREPLPGPLL